MELGKTRLSFDSNFSLFALKSNSEFKLKTNESQAFLLYLGLPNSRITSIDSDDSTSDTSDSYTETESVPSSSLSTDVATSNKIIYETFFSQLTQTFSALNSSDFEELQAETFLSTCEDYFSLVGKFNSAVFTPFKADVNGNIDKLRRKISRNSLRFRTLHAILIDEIETQTTNIRNSATDALLWLKRAFEFLSIFLHEFGTGDQTVSVAANNAYTKSLSQYHGVLARRIFSFALRAVPNNKDFLRSLAIYPDDASQSSFEEQVLNEMLEHAFDLSSVLQKITQFYIEHGLDSSTSRT